MKQYITIAPFHTIFKLASAKSRNYELFPASRYRFAMDFRTRYHKVPFCDCKFLRKMLYYPVIKKGIYYGKERF